MGCECAREGADPTSVRLYPGAESFGNVVLRRGMTSSFDLWDWCERVRRGQGLGKFNPLQTQRRPRLRLRRSKLYRRLGFC